MGTRANVYISDGKRKSLYYRHSDGYPECTGHELRQMASEEKYDYDKIINRLNAASSTYQLAENEAPDAEFIYTIDCNKQTVACFDAYNQRL